MSKHNQTTHPTITFFGTYKQKYARNVMLKNALTMFDYEVREVNIEIPDERLELPEDFTFAKTLKRIRKKLSSSVQLLRHWKAIYTSDIVFVLHPGHLDVPIVKLLTLTRLFSKTKPQIWFDDSISPYDIMFVGRSIAARNSLKARLVKWIEMFTLRLVDKVMVDTKQMKQFLVNELGVQAHKILVIPLGTNEKMYFPARQNVSSSKTSVLFFGLFNPMHGLPFIMDAAKLLKDEKNIEITILGDGYLKDDLIKFVADNALKNVKFKSFMPEEQLVKEIQACDIMLGIFTDSGTFKKVIANKVFAGLACQKAVITADLPATHDFFEHKNTMYLCPPNDAASLADAIQELHTDKKLRQKIADNGYFLFQAQFSTQEIGKVLNKAIESTQNERG